jgi:hypothetical protein
MRRQSENGSLRNELRGCDVDIDLSQDSVLWQSFALAVFRVSVLLPIQLKGPVCYRPICQSQILSLFGS